MSAVATPRRTPAERAMVELVRADAWRFDEPELMEAQLIDLLRQAPGAYDIYELNVIYELMCLSPTAVAVLEVERDGDGSRVDLDELRDNTTWLGHALAQDTKSVDITAMPFQTLLLSIGVSARKHRRQIPPDELVRALNAWRQTTTTMRRTWGGWQKPEGLPQMIANSYASVAPGSVPPGVYASLKSVLTLACESVLRITWLFECAERDAIVYGPVSDRRLPRDPAEAVVTLRRFAEQQPELRKVPTFVHVTTAGTNWLRPREYARLRTMHSDEKQTLAIARDGFDNRRYIHDHLAVIEVDRKPWKLLVLAPEHHDPLTGLMHLNAVMVHERGVFTAEAMVREHQDPERSITLGLVLPFGSHAWRGMGEGYLEQYGKDELAPSLPPDAAVLSIIVAAWRDLVVANVREQQYESKVERDDAPRGKRRARQASRGHVRVIRYLPRLVVIRRAEEAERAAGGAQRGITRAYRVGTFARALREGFRRSPEAQAFADEIGMPLRENQTIVRPHIRGGTEEEREALLAQDDVRTWRSWAAVDLLFATGAAE